MKTTSKYGRLAPLPTPHYVIADTVKGPQLIYVYGRDERRILIEENANVTRVRDVHYASWLAKRVFAAIIERAEAVAV